MLQLGIIGSTERMAEGKRHEEGTRRLHLLRVLPHHADRRRGDALLLQGASQHTSGVRAEGSGRRDERHVRALLAQTPANLRPCLTLADERCRAGHP